MAYIVIGIVGAVAMLLIAWAQVKADQERARRGEPKKHNDQVITVIGFHHNKD